MTPEEKREYNRQYYLANKEKIKQQTRDYRIANPECRKGEKARHRARVGEVGVEKIRAAGRAYAAAHKAEAKAYHLANRETILVKMKAYHLKHREKFILRSREYFHANREELNRKHRERERASGHATYKAWCRRNRAAYLALRTRHYNRRRALKMAAAIGTDRTAYLRFVKDLKSRPKVRCYWCGKITKVGKRHIDHIIALARGGPDDVYNLCCSCVRCNSSKQAKSPEEFNGQGLLPLG